MVLNNPIIFQPGLAYLPLLVLYFMILGSRREMRLIPLRPFKENWFEKYGMLSHSVGVYYNHV